MKITQEFIAKLIEIRKSPRKMQTDYLIKHNLLNDINTIIPLDHWKTKEKIDKIIQNDYKQCYCGKLSKPNSKWCSSYCKDQSDEIKTKISIKNTLNAKERMDKTKKTVFERYGVSHVQQVQHIKQKSIDSNSAYYDRLSRETFSKYGLDYDKFSDPEFIKKICKETSITRLSTSHFNGMPLMTVFRFIYKTCPDIELQKYTSGGEHELSQFIKSLQFEVIDNDRTEIYPYEIDVYVPSKKIGFEFNGLYYHKNDKNKHYQKTQLCNKKGLFLIQIFEDEWAYKNDIVKSIIKSKLQLNKTIPARKTKFKEVPSSDARMFLDNNHIQGAINGKHYGLYLDGVLYSIMSIGKCRYYDGTEILRYCSLIDYNIVGGFSKLLKNIKITTGVQQLYTFADLRFSNGNTYEKYGKYIKTTQPNYCWYHTKSLKRISRYQSQKHKLPKLLGEKFDFNKTENQNMIDSGYEKIYDCGNKLYVV